MFIQTSSSPKATIKVFREKITPDDIWVRLNSDTVIALTLTEAQEVVAGLIRELQAGMAAAKQVQS